MSCVVKIWINCKKGLKCNCNECFVTHFGLIESYGRVLSLRESGVSLTGSHRVLNVHGREEWDRARFESQNLHM